MCVCVGGGRERGGGGSLQLPTARCSVVVRPLPQTELRATADRLSLPVPRRHHIQCDRLAIESGYALLYPCPAPPPGPEREYAERECRMSVPCAMPLAELG
jgi:hypothetical protein